MIGGPPHPQADQDREYLRALFPLFQKYPQFPKDFQFPLTEDSSPPYVPPNNALVYFIVGVILCGITSVIVVLRLWIRWRGGFGMDDWVILASFVFYNAYGIASIYTVLGTGIGYHLYDLSVLDIQNYLLMIPIIVIMLWTSINLSRCSLLHLFLRLSHLQSRKQVLYIRTLLALSYTFAILSMFVIVFECGLPLERLINLESYFDGTCLGYSTMGYHGYLVGVNLILDALTVFPPIVILVGTPLAPKKKFNLIFLLALGVLTMTIGAIRMYVFWQWTLNSYDITWNMGLVVVGGVLEGSLSAIIACLPVLNQKFIQLYRRAFGVAKTERPRTISTRLITSLFERAYIVVSPMKTLQSSNATALSGGTGGTSNSIEFWENKLNGTGSISKPYDNHEGMNNYSDQDITLSASFYISNDKDSDLESQGGEASDNHIALSMPQRARVHYSGRRPSSPTISGALNARLHE